MERQNKPTLLTARRPAREGTRRILASLEHGALTLEQERVPRWKLNSWTTGLCLLLLTMTVLAWSIHQSALTAPQDSPPHVAAPATTGPLLAHVVPAPLTMAASSQAAAIINDTSAPVQVEIVRRADPQRGAIAWVPATPEATVAAGAVARKAAPKATREVVATAHAPSPHVAKATAAVPAAPLADTDVTLLTALVAHAAQPASVIPQRSRDVVERGEQDSTAELLRRCKQLGLIEGMLCHSRICSGRWENEPVCRLPPP
ncbi:hypothetical protein H3H37_20765 [Duganella sp. LX20W]|uniref:Uncharacterized protein n=1 Tax=Rugamonas brunnea TaxID=2758569 RepID=A0A7W2EVP7_9BURK|nr:hypothetical protein [Rugamonas brunnea]MBA5639498.1 hypothetical protein [Rugamonas brunnea]